jgi:hypothetical protein
MSGEITLIEFIKKNYGKSGNAARRLENKIVKTQEFNNILDFNSHPKKTLVTDTELLLSSLSKHQILKKTKTLSAFFSEKGLRESQFLQIIKATREELTKLNIISNEVNSLRDKYAIENEEALTEFLKDNGYYNYYLALLNKTTLKELFLEDGLEVVTYELREKIGNFEELFETGILERIVNKTTGGFMVVVNQKEKLIKILDSIYKDRSLYTKKAKLNFYLSNQIGFSENQCKKFQDYSKKLIAKGIIEYDFEKPVIADVQEFNKFLKQTTGYKVFYYNKNFTSLGQMIEESESHGVTKYFYITNEAEFIKRGIIEKVNTSKNKELSFVVDKNEFNKLISELLEV